MHARLLGPSSSQDPDDLFGSVYCVARGKRETLKLRYYVLLKRGIM